MSKKLATLGLAAGLSLTPLAHSAEKTSIQNDTNTNLTETMTMSKKQQSNAINFLDAQREIELRKQIRGLLKSEFADNNEIKELKEKYGEDFIVDQMALLVSTISKDPDQFWSFNKDGNFIPNEEKIQELLKDIFWEDTPLWQIILSVFNVMVVVPVSVWTLITGRKEE